MKQWDYTEPNALLFLSDHYEDRGAIWEAAACRWLEHMAKRPKKGRYSAWAIRFYAQHGQEYSAMGGDIVPDFRLGGGWYARCSSVCYESLGEAFTAMIECTARALRLRYDEPDRLPRQLEEWLPKL